MSQYRSHDLTNGYLPVAAFQHLRPTEMSFVDLDGPPALISPVGDLSDAGDHDGLLLVRLHGEPLAIIHVPRMVRDLAVEDLAALIWQEAEQRIREHVEMFRCGFAPDGVKSLLSGFRSVAGGCSGARVAEIHPSVSVIVPTGGRADQLERCLRSLLALERPHLDILVVDNQPGAKETRRTFDAIASEGSRVRYIAEPRPGSSVARNRGIAETSAEFVAFTDDDIIIDPHWLDWLLSPFVDPAVTVVTGMVLPLELQSEAQKRFEQFAGFSKGITRRSYDLQTTRADNRILYPYWGGIFGSGNSMAFRRADLVAAGGFDPALGAGSLALAGADIEAFSSAILRGGRLVYEPRSLCWHEHRRDDEALRRQLFNYGVGCTAILTKYLLRDPGFLGAVARSVPLELRRREQNTSEQATSAELPKVYARLFRRGMLRGPRLYGKSRRWARRLQLDDAIQGR
jgi:GT2 family glycosyltransferase